MWQIIIVFKYLEQEYLIQFKETGRIRLGTLYEYRDTENRANQARADAYEGRSRRRIEPNNEPVELTAQEAGRFYPQAAFREGLTIMPKAHAFSETTVLNAFIFCTSCRLDVRLMKKWGGAYYKIIDPFQFSKIICDELSKHVPLQICVARRVKYVETKDIEITNKNKETMLGQISSNALDGYFTKPDTFKDDKEFRLVFVPMPEVHISARCLECKKLLTCCEF